MDSDMDHDTHIHIQHHNDDVSGVSRMLDLLGAHERAQTPDALLNRIKHAGIAGASCDQPDVIAHIDDARTHHHSWKRTLGFAVAATLLVGASVPVLTQMRSTSKPTPDPETQLAAYESDYEFVFAMLDDLDRGLSSNLAETSSAFEAGTDPTDAVSLLDLWETADSSDEETMG